MTAPAHVLAAVRSIPHPRQEPTMTAPHPSPAGLAPLLDQLDALHAAGDALPLSQGHEDGEHCWILDKDRTTAGWAVLPEDAALIVAAVNALPTLIAELRKRDAALKAVEATA